MRLRQRGRYAYSQNTNAIVWRSTEPPKGSKVYTVAWQNGQTNLIASGTYTQP